jgi:hypothetical protein
LAPAGEVVMTVSEYPMVVILPEVSSLSVTVFDSAMKQTANFSSPADVFAVCFHDSVGQIFFTSTSFTTLPYFAIKPPFSCPSFYVSSAPIETWSASQTTGNFTIGNNQDICLFHVSDSVTNISGAYDAGPNSNFLEYAYSGSPLRTGNYTGNGVISDSSKSVTTFRWLSGQSNVSTSFSIRLSSPFSLLPYREGQGSITAAGPVIVMGRVPDPAPIPVIVSGTGRNLVSLTTGQGLAVTIAYFPLFLILPILTDVEVTVFGPNGVETGRFSTPTNVFAIHFSRAGGRVVFRATAPTGIRTFAIGYPSAWACSLHYLSSAPVEAWSASATDGNFTITDSQDICLFHVSDNRTRVSGYFDTEPGFDGIYYQYSGGTSTKQWYTGTDRISDSANMFTTLRWHSDSSYVSNMFSVQLSSPLSSLPYRECQGSGTSDTPIILEDKCEERTPTMTEERRATDTSSSDVLTTSEDGETPSKAAFPVAIVLGIVVPFVVLILFVICCLCYRRYRARGPRRGDGRYGIFPESWRLDDASSPDSDMEMRMSIGPYLQRS